MTTKKTTEPGSLRRCIGSAKFGIESHEAPPSDFPVQPSQKDGLGRMCKVHWNQYTNSLRKAAQARKADDPEPDPTEPATKPVKEPKPAPALAPEKVAKVRAAKAKLAATETLAGTEYTEAIGSDEVQAALEVIAGADTATVVVEDEQEAAVA